MTVLRALLVYLALAYGATPFALQGDRTVGLPATVLQEVREPTALPAGTYELVRRWSVVTGAQHTTGRAVTDLDAAGQRAWEARPGRAVVGKALVYGPYLEVPSGDYVAFVRMKVTEDVGAERVADLDAVVDYGQTVCTAMELPGYELRVGKYRRVPLAFRCPGGKLEIRVHWSGYTPLLVDTVELYRLVGGSVGSGVRRAPEAVPSGRPADLDPPAERRPYPDIFPVSNPPTDPLLVCDITRETPDVQLCVFVLQGLANRKRPALYCLYNSTDTMWLNWIRRNGYIKSTRSVARWTALLPMFRSRYRGLVVTDPALPATKNIANMVASVEDCLVVSPRMLRTFAKEWAGLAIKADLRGRWQTSADAYKWALEHLWPKLNHHLAACSYPEHLGLRDYLTQHRAFIFWISGPIDGAAPYANPTAEARVAEELLARMPPNSPIMSYPWAAKDVGIGEGPGVTLFAEFGKYLVGSINCTNLSVHSGFKVSLMKPRSAPVPRLDKNKVYLSFIMSDGDNLPVLTISNFPQLWTDPNRGKVPMGWTLSPSASLLIPAVVQYYYSTATPNDAFLGAVSGVGYTYPDSYGLRYKAEQRQAVFDGFLTQTETYMNRAGLRSLWIMNATQPEKIRRYAERIGPLEALFPDYGKRVSDYGEATYPSARNVPVFHAVSGWTENATREQKIKQMVEEIRSMTPSERPAFMHAFIWNWGADMSVYPEVMKRLGPGYVAVRPDHLAALYRQDLGWRQLLVRMPTQTMAIEGRPVSVGLMLQNVTRQPMSVQLKPLSGMQDASLTPSTVLLEPSESAEVTLTGSPDADEVAFLVQAPFGERRYALPIRRVPGVELGDAVLPDGVLRFVRRYEAETLPHGSGAALADTGAAGSVAWKADATCAKAGYIVFGPYASLPAGKYVALYRLKGEGAGVLGLVDTCVGGGHPITSSREVREEELAGNGYRVIPLVFTHPGGPVETRVQWSGHGRLTVDWIALWRVAP